MIRLVLLLCAGLWLTAMIVGADHGQKRYGLMLADSQPKPVVTEAAMADAVVFVPAQPVIQPAPVAPTTAAPAAAIDPAPAVIEAVAEPPVAQPEQITPEPEALPKPQILGGLLYTVTAKQANVRGGPGRNFAVMGSVTRGEQVLVVIEDQPLEGWSRIRIEGDGIEGYVSTKLLTRSE